MHPVHGSATQLTGFVDAVCDDATVALDPPPQMHVEFPIEGLASGNGLQDRQMWKLLDSKRNPIVRADLRELRGLGGNRYAAGGEITLCGRSRRYDGELTIALNGARMSVDGDLRLDIRDFGIQPPRFLTLTVQPEVNVRLRLVAALG